MILLSKIVNQICKKNNNKKKILKKTHIGLIEKKKKKSQMLRTFQWSYFIFYYFSHLFSLFSITFPILFFRKDIKIESTKSKQIIFK
jgi:hypothetical protein